MLLSQFFAQHKVKLSNFETASFFKNMRDNFEKKSNFSYRVLLLKFALTLIFYQLQNNLRLFLSEKPDQKLSR